MDTLPTGLIMALAQDREAMNFFAGLTNQEQENIVNYIQSAITGDDAKQRIETAVQNMHNSIKFFKDKMSSLYPRRHLIVFEMDMNILYN